MPMFSYGNGFLIEIELIRRRFFLFVFVFFFTLVRSDGRIDG